MFSYQIDTDTKTALIEMPQKAGIDSFGFSLARACEISRPIELAAPNGVILDKM
jgi:hypothetical protein